MQSWAWQRKSESGKEENLFRQLGALIPAEQRIGHYWRTHSVLPPPGQAQTGAGNTQLARSAAVAIGYRGPAVLCKIT